MIKTEERKMLIISPETHKALKIRSAITGEKVQDVADRILKNGLKNEK